MTPGEWVGVGAYVIQDLTTKLRGGAIHHSRDGLVEAIGFLRTKLLDHGGFEDKICIIACFRLLLNQVSLEVIVEFSWN